MCDDIYMCDDIFSCDDIYLCDVTSPCDDKKVPFRHFYYIVKLSANTRDSKLCTDCSLGVGLALEPIKFISRQGWGIAEHV